MKYLEMDCEEFEELWRDKGGRYYRSPIPLTQGEELTVYEVKNGKRTGRERSGVIEIMTDPEPGWIKYSFRYPWSPGWVWEQMQKEGFKVDKSVAMSDLLRYRFMQINIQKNLATLGSEERMPPCFDCTPEVFYYCQETGTECGSFKLYVTNNKDIDYGEVQPFRRADKKEVRERVKLLKARAE